MSEIILDNSLTIFPLDRKSWITRYEGWLFFYRLKRGVEKKNVKFVSWELNRFCSYARLTTTIYIESYDYAYTL